MCFLIVKRNDNSVRHKPFKKCTKRLFTKGKEFSYVTWYLKLYSLTITQLANDPLSKLPDTFLKDISSFISNFRTANIDPLELP